MKINFKNKEFIICFLFALVLLVNSPSSIAQNLEESVEHSADSSNAHTQGFLFLPLFYYTPDTRFAFGGLGVHYFRLKGDRGATPSRLSYAKILADYTINHQLDVWGSWNIFLKNETYILKGELRFRNFPDKFYGIGNQTPVEDIEHYDYNLLSIRKQVLKKIRPGLFVGGNVQFVYSYNYHYEQEGQLASGNISGWNGGLISGFGLVGIYDDRDNVVYPTKGTYLELSSYFYGGYLFSEYRFNNYNFVYSRYFKVYKELVFASNTVFNMNAGQTPFIYMAMVGNDDILRGYARNRYRDQNFMGTQVELRMPLFWRIGAATFAGLGDVFNAPSDMSLSALKYSYGAGLRYTVNKKEHLNIRFDYGFGRGRGNNSFYLMLSEAF
jgi:outer membrane protein assembly factor BamA